jgi:hypothetical protein
VAAVATRWCAIERALHYLDAPHQIEPVGALAVAAEQQNGCASWFRHATVLGFFSEIFMKSNTYIAPSCLTQ